MCVFVLRAKDVVCLSSLSDERTAGKVLLPSSQSSRNWWMKVSSPAQSGSVVMDASGRWSRSRPGLTLTGRAARRWRPLHSPRSSAETGSDWPIPSGGSGSQTAPRWFLFHTPGKQHLYFLLITWT